MTIKEVLIAAKALIDTKNKWFGGDQIAGPNSLCMLWAIYRTTPDVALELDAIEAIQKVLPPSAGKDVARYNDTHTHRTCMRIMDRAIELAS